MSNIQRAADEILEKIVNDISDRRGLGDEWGSIDEDIQQEIRDTWRGFIVSALESKHG